MSRPYRIAALIGSTSNKSRTQALVNAITKALGHQVPVDVHLVELSKLGSQFGAATRKDQLSAQALSALEQIEQADLVIAASPVYKGSYTGLFKHVIDFIGDRHALVVEHQLRPLFGFFRAHTIPTSVYASEADLAGYEVSSLALQERINEAAAQAAGALRQAYAADVWLQRAA